MKKVIVLFGVLSLTAGLMAQSWVVTKKKGKCTMEEAYYNQIKQKADNYDTLQAQIADLQNRLEKAERQANHRPQLITFNDSASYAIGRDLFENWEQQQLGINYEVVATSLLDCIKGKNHWDRKVMTPLLSRFQHNFEVRQREKEARMQESMGDNIAAGQAFLAENAKSKSVVTTSSGLQYRVERAGSGKKPTLNDRVKVHYTGKLIDGKTFDSSVQRGEPIVIGLREVIPGWTEGLQLMNEGAKYTFYIPYNLGYGERIAGEIPPGSTLIFEVELLEINPQ